VKPKVQEKYNIFTSELIFQNYRAAEEKLFYEVLWDKTASAPFCFLHYIKQSLDYRDRRFYTLFVDKLSSSIILMQKHLYHILWVSYRSVSYFILIDYEAEIVVITATFVLGVLCIVITANRSMSKNLIDKDGEQRLYNYDE